MDETDKRLVSKLSFVLDKFVNGYRPKDDTLIEKLLIWLKQEFSRKPENLEIILQSTQMLDWMKNCLSKRNLDPDILAFILRLAGYVGSQIWSDPAALSCIQTYFEVVNKDDELWKDASVRCGWSDGLASLVHICDNWLCTKDILDKILESLSDSSWFVRKSAINLISELFISRATISTEQNSIDQVEECTSKITKHLVNIVELELNSSILLQSVLGVLERIASNERCLELFKSSENSLVCQLYKLLERLTDPKSEGLCLEVLKVISIIHKSAVCSEEIERCTDESLKRMVDARQIYIAVHLASWALQRNVCSEHAEYFQTVCSLPLLTILDQVDGHMSVNGAEPRVDVVEKLSMISQLKLCLRQLTDLSCHLKSPDSVVDSVAQLLKLTLKSHATLGRHQFLATNARIKQSCLDLLHAFFKNRQESCVFSKSEIISVIIIDILQQTEDQIVVDKSYGLALLLMQAFVHISGSSLNSSFDDFLKALHDCVVKSLSSPVWDVRDTALAFIGSVYSTFPGEGSFCPWMNNDELFELIWKSIGDEECYVRASALYTIATLFDSATMRTKMTSHVSQDVMLDKVFELCEHDMEISSRRAAFDLVIKFYRSSDDSIQRSCILDMMSIAVQDFDWDIKLNGIKFWSAYTTELCDRVDALQTDNAARKDLLEKICAGPCAIALLFNIDDFDISVRQLALKELALLRSRLSEMDMKECDLSDLSKQFLKTLFEGDWQTRSDNLTADCCRQNSDTEALLDDILACSVIPMTHDAEGFSDDEDTEVVVDCY